MNSAYARDDGTVRVAVERPVGPGFDHAECLLPRVNWFKVEGFSTIMPRILVFGQHIRTFLELEEALDQKPEG